VVCIVYQVSAVLADDEVMLQINNNNDNLFIISIIMCYLALRRLYSVSVT